jgi:hypothetical protein
MNLQIIIIIADKSGKKSAKSVKKPSELSQVEDELNSMRGTSDVENALMPRLKSVRRRDVGEGSPSKSTSAATHDKLSEKGSIALCLMKFYVVIIL